MGSLRVHAALALALAIGLGACGGGDTGGNPVVVPSPTPSPSSSPTPPPSPTATAHADLAASAGRTIAEPLRGLTIETLANAEAAFTAVSAHARVPTVRLVFQPGEPPATYSAFVSRLRPRAFVIGELVDSDALAGMSVAQVRQRASDYWTTLGSDVDLWEIGNELNGDWVGTGPAEINAKLDAAYDVIVRQHHAKAMITLNYWSGPDCYARDWEPTVSYARTIPEEIRLGTSYLALSFYETACSPRQQPDAAAIAAMMTDLAPLFPNARLLLGEIGAQRAADGVANPDLAEKQRIANRYMGMHADLSRLVGTRFIGGYFWWYYADDAVPRDAQGSLWPTIEAQFNAM